MTIRDLVLKALNNHKIVKDEYGIGNDFIMDDRWHIELDYDGAAALTISNINPIGYFKDTHVLVVFKNEQENMDESLSEIESRVTWAVHELINRKSYATY